MVYPNSTECGCSTSAGKVPRDTVPLAGGVVGFGAAAVLEIVFVSLSFSLLRFKHLGV